MLKRSFLGGVLVVMLAVGACKDDPAPAPTPVPSTTPSVTKEVSSTGGQVALPGGQTLDIPAGALDTPTKIEIAEADPAKIQPKPAQIDFVTKPVVFTPHGLKFKVPITVTLPYTSDRTDLVVLRLDDEKDTTWEIVPSTFEGGKARFQTSRFSYYIVGLRLDANATCQELCPRIGACATDCAARCGSARQACLPESWGRVATCLDTATAPPVDCGRVASCLGAEACTGFPSSSDAGAPVDAATIDAATDSSVPVDGGACGPVATFTDTFTRANGPAIGDCWITYPAQLPVPSLNSQRACADEQSAALMRINQAPTTVAYDWTADGAAGLETNAIAALDTAGTLTSGFFAGVDGGSTPQRLFIKSLSGTTIAGPVDVTLTAATPYRVSATFNPTGAISVTLTTGATTVGTLSGNAGGAITFNRAGFVVGRSVDTNLTCLDNFTITQ